MASSASPTVARATLLSNPQPRPRPPVLLPRLQPSSSPATSSLGALPCGPPWGYRDRLGDTAHGNLLLPFLSLFDCLRWDWMAWKLRPRAIPRVINYSPQPRRCRLGHLSGLLPRQAHAPPPLCRLGDLMPVDGCIYESYVDGGFLH